jgi:1,4-dihydroxy-2-naphthoate octaprenyltransferase
LALKLGTYFLAARPWSFTMTLISVTLGSLLGSRGGPFGWAVYLPTLVGMIFVHAATNLLNDYCDIRHGVDRPDSPTARYREHPLLTGRLEPAQVLAAARLLYGLALADALLLAAWRGWAVLGLAAAGGLASVFYSAGPVQYKHRGGGELSVFLMWGPLMMLGASYLQTASWSAWPRVLPIAVVQGLWVALVIFANNLKDIAYDRHTAVTTLAVLLGRRRGLAVYSLSLAVIYLLTGLQVLAGILPVWSLLAFASLPIAAGLVRSFHALQEIPVDADPRTARVGMIFGVLLVGSLLLQRLVPLA